VVTVAAFTMTTCLLLGLLSAAAIGATRAVAGGPADDPSLDAAADVASEEASEDAAGHNGTKGSGTKPKTTAGKKAKGGKSAKSATSEPRRAGGAVSPRDALDRKGDVEEAP